MTNPEFCYTGGVTLPYWRQKMPMGRPGKVKWTEDQEETIRARYASMGPKALAEMLGVDLECLKRRAWYLGLSSKPPPFQWTEEREKVLAVRYVTDGPGVLGKEWGISPLAVTAKARRMGLGQTRKRPPKDFRWSEEMDQVLKDRYVKEGGLVLARDLNLSTGAVRSRAAFLGLHTTAGHVARGKRTSAANTSHDIHYFDEWSADMAYVLGFTFADGSVSSKKTELRYQIGARDRSVLEYIKDQLQTTSTIKHSEGKIHPRTGNKEEDSVFLGVGSTVLVARLAALGLHPRKTYRDDPFPWVPDDLMGHFIRGYFDGDGCARAYKDKRWDTFAVSFVGSPKFIRGVRNVLVDYAEMSAVSVIFKKGKTADWCTAAWTRVVDHQKFYDFIYPEGFSFCMERKKAKLDAWLAKPHPETVAHRRFTEEEEQDIIKSYYAEGPTKLAARLGRDRVTVICKAKSLGLKIGKQREREPVTEEE